MPKERPVDLKTVPLMYRPPPPADLPEWSDSEIMPLIIIENSLVVEKPRTTDGLLSVGSEILLPQSPEVTSFEDQEALSAPLSPNRVRKGHSQDMPAEGSIFDVSPDVPGFNMRPAGGGVQPTETTQLTSFQSESGLNGECKQKLKVALMSVKTSVVSYFRNHEGTKPLLEVPEVVAVDAGGQTRSPEHPPPNTVPASAVAPVVNPVTLEQFVSPIPSATEDIGEVANRKSVRQPERVKVFVVEATDGPPSSGRCQGDEDIGPDLKREGPFDVSEVEPDPGQCSLVLNSMPGCQFRMTSYDEQDRCGDLDPAYGIHLHDPV